MEFDKAYKNLNSAQKQAVDTIDGPLLVIAGPGTGKTQLLSARVAKIMQKTDTLPQNILCLTFTESGAANMRERLTQFIGQAAYDVQINTYHAFGSEIIRKYSEYFTEFNMQNPIDDLGRHQIFKEIVDNLSYANPLKRSSNYLNDLIGTISDIKRATLQSQDLQKITDSNLSFLNKTNTQIEQIFSDFTSMPRKFENAVGYFEKLQNLLQEYSKTDEKLKHGTLCELALQSLNDALTEGSQLNKTSPLTVWKNSWLEKDANNKFILSGKTEALRVQALSEVLDQYQQKLQKDGLYDFDDMILQTIKVLQKNDDLKFTLQEQYLYILLDEFQDTNAAQAQLVDLMCDNPVNENKPNVMAVGDDDQAIYAFQGAHVSNMLDFAKKYDDVKIVNLSENYRSHGDIISSAKNIAEQIDSRLAQHFKDVDKNLIASNKKLAKDSKIIRQDFLSAPAEYDWVAKNINNLIEEHGVSPSQIAVLAPKHKCLEPLVPHLNSLKVPIRYEKRENILETPIIKRLLAMVNLVLALNKQDEYSANAYWAEILSFEFWQIDIAKIWQISWEVSDSYRKLNWSKQILQDETLRPIGLFFKTLSGLATTETMEVMLDYLIGSTELKIVDETTSKFCSPMRQFYTNSQVQSTNPDILYQTVSQLSVLRSRLREHQTIKSETFLLQDLIDFVNLYISADQRMINTSPYNQSSESVQLMTVYKAKGLEFEHVFLLDTQDDVWGESSKPRSNNLSLPKNLKPIRHAGASQDERLRLLFVAITRAKIGLYLTSYLQKFSGKSTKRLKYLNEQEQPDNSFKAMALPQNNQQVIYSESEASNLNVLLSSWQDTHQNALNQTRLKDLLQNRLQNYKLSPTHLNTFTDMEYGGPQVFLINTLLKFPQAPTSSGQFGNAMHESLEWLQKQVNTTNKIPTTKQLTDKLVTEIESKHLSQTETKLLTEKGVKALNEYYKQKIDSFKKGDEAEFSFANEGIFVGDAHLSGKIDKLEIDKTNKTITVVDYKTGQAYTSWKSELKLHKYKQQLYCYKILVEQSHTFAGYKVISQRLEFVEPDENGKIQTLELKFNENEFKETKHLLQKMWKLVQNLEFPDVSEYTNDFAGNKKFEDFLLKS